MTAAPARDRKPGWRKFSTGSVPPGSEKASSLPPSPEVPVEEPIQTEGTVTTVLAGTMFRIKLDNSQHIVLAHISGKMRKRFIRLTVGDRVRLEMSPYDMNKARITYRLG